MSVVFPSLKPTSREFILGTFPTKVYRSLAGTTAKRSFGNQPSAYQLTLTFANISDEAVVQIINHYNETSGGFSRFRLPVSIFSGMDPLLRDQVRSPYNIQWEYASPPTIQSVYRDISTVTVELSGELNV